jgi:IS1 family transposase
MAVNETTIGLVRALVKLSSALYDIDELKLDKRYKFNLKKELNIWHEWSEEYIKTPISSFGNVDSETLMTLINIFNDFDKSIFVIDDFTTRINLFLAKTESALQDLENFESSNSIYTKYINVLKTEIKNILSKNYFNKYIKYVDPEGNTYKSIVESLNNVSNKIIVGSD